MTAQYTVTVFLIPFLVEGLSLPSLENVTVDSENLNSVIHWNPASHFNKEALKYIVQYRLSGFDEWFAVPGCAPTVETQCNFTSIARPYANVTLRVRVQAGEQTSAWSKTLPFVAHLHTRLSRPNVTLFPEDPSSLRIEIVSHPNLRKWYGDTLRYQIFYGKEKENLTYFGDSSSPVMIKSLETGEKYCVQVCYTIDPGKKLKSRSSNLECVIIKESERKRSIHILWLSVLFVSISGAVILGCILVVFRNYSRLKDSLWPDLHMPECFNEHLPSQHSWGSASVYCSSESVDELSLILENEECPEKRTLHGMRV